MQKRIATTALAALIATGSLFGALAKPASADADDHARAAQHHHAYQHDNDGNRNGWRNGNGNTGNWVNGKHYAYGNRNSWNGNRNTWNRGDHDRDDRAKQRHHKDRDDRR